MLGRGVMIGIRWIMTDYDGLWRIMADYANLMIGRGVMIGIEVRVRVKISGRVEVIRI